MQTVIEPHRVERIDGAIDLENRIAVARI